MQDLGSAIFLFRPVLLVLGGLAQVYLVFRLRRALQGLGWSERSRARATWAIGVALSLLWGLHATLVLARLPWLEPPRVAQIGLLYPSVVGAYGAIGSALVLLALRAGARLCRLVTLGWRWLAGATPPPADLGRRRVLQAGAGVLAVAPFVLVGYGAAYAARACQLTELSLPFGRSLRLVHLSDLHAGPYMTREAMKGYVDLLNTLQPDLVVLTGDFLSTSMVYLYGCAEELARVRARHGTFAVLGNHEHWYGNPREIAAVFRAYEIALLTNAHQILQTPQGPFAVAGIDDLGSGQADLGAALRGLDAALPTLLLSHHPEIFPQAAHHGIPLTLAGHWHGGQIRLHLPGRDLSVAHLLSPYPEGLYRLGASHLYVSRGLGTAWAPIRLNAPPEVVLYHLA